MAKKSPKKADGRKKSSDPEVKNTVNYHLMQNGKIVHSGKTCYPDQREEQHQERWPNSVLKVQGKPKTDKQARAWEDKQEKSITPERLRKKSRKLK